MLCEFISVQVKVPGLRSLGAPKFNSLETVYKYKWYDKYGCNCIPWNIQTFLKNSRLHFSLTQSNSLFLTKDPKNLLNVHLFKGEMQRFWVFDFFDAKCVSLTVNTGKLIVYCRSLTWLSSLGKPRLWRQSVFSSPVWAIAITWRQLSVCKLFQKSSPLKPLGQFKPNLTWIILRGFPLKVMSDDPADQPSWPPCL